MQRLGCGPTGGDDKRDLLSSFASRTRKVKYRSHANSYMYTNDLRAETNTAEYTRRYMETCVRVQQGLEGPLGLRSSVSFSPVDREHMQSPHKHTHTNKQTQS